MKGRLLLTALIAITLIATATTLSGNAQQPARYKVIQSCSASGILALELLERDLNAGAADGWRLFSFDYLGRGCALAVFQRP